MKKERGMSIKLKLNLLGLLVIVGLISMAVITYNAGQRVQNSMREDIKTQQISTEMLLLRRHEKDFLARLDMKYAGRHAETLAKLQEHITGLKGSYPLAGITDEEGYLAQLSSLFASYGEKFSEVVAIHEEIGFASDKGLRGKLRGAVHNAEKQIREQSNQNLMAKMLMLRRAEKDFLLRLVILLVH